jgi:ribosomal protein S18 acetylase RimI-like enzyme
VRQILITYDDIQITAENLAGLLEQVGFGSASTYLDVPDFRSIFLGPGTVSVFAIEKPTQQLIGLARVFTDNLFTTYISEVCVHPNFQKKGIGLNLIKAITNRFCHTAIFTDAFRGEISIFTKNSIMPKEKLIACSCRPHYPDLITH